ncbi:potassium channel subfamily K member 5-like [Bubalus kerabau]|uniref:potassium channel subfamily K member 5-like n=1 Tax=Bubalus carabanensis TaxID=3119969 RepID=UPI00244E938C|nr:potassium channel subfamily K member 5-like [Bubalus carabanensis]XP_055394191.1 potassium channel subfamily K member 5-like [Bubalus carabanensis]XP_055394192.1 potassium channel subfamily K member 5-like [Bubalus carabanensis]XP_055394193.1 potassium channel subfamily K member 5-like [Bubalus carabanensis]XP_055394194.1 potassium channel subfamily K member 5-like [Bubalus carabanensis]XP_055394196.1 potassium channel subfamily K member 5-like [Bubalus carabanensis]
MGSVPSLEVSSYLNHFLQELILLKNPGCEGLIFTFSGCSPDLLSLRLLRLNTVSRKDDGEALATHSSTLAWKLPWAEEPGFHGNSGSNSMMTSLILSGIPPTGNRTTVFFWTFTNSFITCIIILSTIGYGTIFPKTSGGQMFCIVFATIGIPLTIMLFKYIFILVYLPFEKFGIYLQHKGLNEKNVYLWKNFFFAATGSFFFLVLPPFLFMSLENWSYIEGIYYSFNTISAIGFGDYTVVSNPTKDNQDITYSILLLIWNLYGLAWIALLFNLIASFFQEMGSRLNKDTSETEVEEEKELSSSG